MDGDDSGLMELARAVAVGDSAFVSQLLEVSPMLASAHLERGASRQEAKAYWLEEIEHYVYGGDTALHVSAAGHRLDLSRVLVLAGADVRARNRRGAEPLHYAADGQPGSRTWRPEEQAATVRYLIAAGADPDASDKSGVTPLHRAVRTRCAAAVGALLDDGADVLRTNASGSTPIELATRNTGRGGSGSPEAKAQQAEILELLRRHGATR